jgi:hypothetical protein
VRVRSANAAARRDLGTSNVLGDGIYKLGADVMPVAPDHLVSAVPGELLAVEEQHEVIENIDSIDVQPNAFGGNIGDEAVAGCNANPELDRSKLPQAMTRGPASFVKIQRTHDARFQIVAAPLRLATASLSENTYRMAIAEGLIRALEFFLHLSEIDAAALRKTDAMLL